MFFHDSLGLRNVESLVISKCISVGQWMEELRMKAKLILLFEVNN